MPATHPEGTRLALVAAGRAHVLVWDVPGRRRAWLEPEGRWVPARGHRLVPADAGVQHVRLLDRAGGRELAAVAVRGVAWPEGAEPPVAPRLHRASTSMHAGAGAPPAVPRPALAEPRFAAPPAGPMPSVATPAFTVEFP
jgi:hypothetical protein